ncbi:hypothetical protein ACLK2H_16595 [Escherichia coli]
MKKRAIVLAFGATLLLSGCQNMDSNGLLNSSTGALQAFSLSDQQVRALSNQACKDMDSKATIAPAGSDYVKRLNRLPQPLATTSTASR